MKRKFVCLLLALVLCVAWAVPALAAEGESFDIYQIAAPNGDGSYTITEAWEGFVKIENNVAQYGGEGNWTNFTETLSADAIQSFLTYAKEQKMKPTDTVQEQGGSILFTDKDEGYYLIDYGNGTCGLYNWQGQNEMPHKKNDGGPGVEKKIKLANGDLVDWTTVKLGDNVQFEVKVTLPGLKEIEEYGSEFFYPCWIGDQVSDGLAPNRDVTIQIDGKDIEITKKDDKGAVYTISDTDGDYIRVSYDSEKHFGLDFGKDGGGSTNGPLAFVKLHPGAKLTLNYSAKVIQRSAQTPKEYNKVWFGYGEETKEDIVHVYDFTIILDKVDANGRKPLNGAEFVLAKKNEDGTESFFWSDRKDDNSNHSGDVVKWRSDAELNYDTGEFTLPGDVESRLSMVRVTEKYNADGKTHFEGISTGTYYLYEIKAPDGYTRRKEPVIISIREIPNQPIPVLGEDDSSAVKFEYQIGENGEWKTIGSGEGLWGSGWNQLLLSTEIENIKNDVLLPSTGGIGTTVFYLAGGALVLGAVIVLIVKRRGKAN